MVWFISALVLFNTSRNDANPVLEIMSGTLTSADSILLVMVLVSQIVINSKISALAVPSFNQAKEAETEEARIFNSLTIWNKAKYFRFGLGFQYIRMNGRCAIRLLHSPSFKRKPRGKFVLT